MNRSWDNTEMPSLMYGTAWKEDDTRRLTRLAIDCGFRAIDTANQRKHYVEAAVGEAIEEAVDDGVVDREELFVQTKFTYSAGQDHRLPYDPEAPYSTQVEQSLDSSLEHLRTDYVDALILHGPSTRVGLSRADREVWQTLETLSKTDEVGMIGVSNVTASQLETWVEMADVAPAFVQNRCFAKNGWDAPVRGICADEDITYQGFSLLTANRRALADEKMVAIAERHDKTIPQIVFRFAVDIGMLPLTGTTSETHMNQDLAIGDFSLADDEIEAIETIAHRR